MPYPTTTEQDFKIAPDQKPPTKFLSVRVSPEEMAELRKLAAASNLRLSDFVRETLQLESHNARARIDRASNRYLPDPETTRAVARAGNNLNQIARALNLANRKGATVTLRHLVALLQDVQDALATVRRGKPPS
jgi:hypothetical protein